MKKLIVTCYYSSPIAGQQFQYRFDENGQMLFSFENESEITDEAKHPYKAIVTQVYDKTGGGGVDMLDVAELFKSVENELTELMEDGDFRSEECLALLDEADIVVTNPPFSLFREYVATLIEHGKHFIIIGNVNAITFMDKYSPDQFEIIGLEIANLGLSVGMGTVDILEEAQRDEGAAVGAVLQSARQANRP